MKNNKSIKIGKEHRLCLSNELNVDVSFEGNHLNVCFLVPEEGMIFEWSFTKGDFIKLSNFLDKFKNQLEGENE
jgi:hypothetical protein